MKHSTRFSIGIIILFANQLLTWLAIGLCVYLAAKTGNKKFLLISGIVYFVSWGVFFIGIYLAGSEGVNMCKKLIKKLLKINLNK